jgi:hypothetical protein
MTPAELREQIVRASEATQVALCTDPSCPIDVLIVLSRSPSARVRAAVGLRAQCPLGTHLRLANDPDEQVRAAVAASEGLLWATAARLADDPSPLVRQALADNPRWVRFYAQRWQQR